MEAVGFKVFDPPYFQGLSLASLVIIKAALDSDMALLFILNEIRCQILFY
jgi:hypothetical protein